MFSTCFYAYVLCIKACCKLIQMCVNSQLSYTRYVEAFRISIYLLLNISMLQGRTNILYNYTNNKTTCSSLSKVIIF